MRLLLNGPNSRKFSLSTEIPKADTKKTFNNADTSKPQPRLWPAYFVLGSILGGSLYLLGKDDANETMKDVSIPMRIVKRLTGWFNKLEEPAFEKLLPPAVIDPQHPRPYTLVIDLDKFLVYHFWDKEQGRWRIAKRPGAELFLFYAAQLYEVVVFSSLPQHEGDAIVKKLDPYGCISYSLYRFATQHRRGTYLKDISRLNRDQSKILVLGQDEAGFSPHPENFIKMKPWKGKGEQNALEHSIDFLEMVAFSRLDDLRTLSTQFKDKSFPAYFDKIQEEAYSKSQESRKNSLQSKISSLFSLNPPGSKHIAATSQKSYWDRKNERTEKRRAEFERIKGMMQKQLEAEQAKEKEYYAENKMALWDVFARGPAPAPPPNPTQDTKENK